MSAEITFIVGVALVLIGLTTTHFFSRSLLSLVPSGAGLSICAWVLLAGTMTPSVDDITYHSIKYFPAVGGGVVDCILFQDVDGKKHFVNINRTMGIKIPNDGRTYKIARVSYKKHRLGLSFSRSSKYQLIVD